MSAEKKQEPQAAQTPAGHVPVDFPRDFPLHSVMHIVGHLRKTEVLPLSELLQHAGVILGCAGAIMGPTPPPQSTTPEDYTAKSDEELAATLEESLAPQSTVPAGAFPAWIIPIVLEIVRRYFGI